MHDCKAFKYEMAQSILTWDAFREPAAMIFNIWVGSPELAWAEEAWQIIAAAGLAAYEGEPEKTLVNIRFLALACFYRDFCYLVWGEDAGPEFLEWFDVLKLSSFRIGQLIGHVCDSAEEEPIVALDETLHVLINRARPEVVKALLQGDGTTSGLFVALWNSSLPAAGLPEDDDENRSWLGKESRYEILNDVTPEKSEAFSWLGHGAEEILSGPS